MYYFPNRILMQKDMPQYYSSTKGCLSVRHLCVKICIWNITLQEVEVSVENILCVKAGIAIDCSVNTFYSAQLSFLQTEHRQFLICLKRIIHSNEYTCAGALVPISRDISTSYFNKRVVRPDELFFSPYHWLDFKGSAKNHLSIDFLINTKT